MILVAFQDLATWQRGIKMCVSAKCQWLKHLLQRQTAGGGGGGGG